MDIIQITTPFHFRMLELLKDEIKIEECLIFYSEYIDKNKLLKSFPEAKCFIMENFNIRFQELLFLRGFNRLALFHNSIRQTVFNHIKDNSANRYICFNDRNHFSQYLYKKVDFYQVILIDEGAELYQLKQKGWLLKKVLYPLITPLILKGFCFKYYHAMGIHPRTNVIYARNVEAIPNKRCHVKYIGIKVKKKKNTCLVNSNKVLVLTSPGFEDRLIDRDQELTFVSQILEILNNNSYQIDIKLHPREQYNKYHFLTKFQCQLIDKNIPSEDLNYFQYSYIINFFSSAVFDIIENDYPKEKVLTLKLYSFSNSVRDVFKKTKIIENLEEFNKFIEEQNPKAN
jgi:hypothetical protein